MNRQLILVILLCITAILIAASFVYKSVAVRGSEARLREVSEDATEGLRAKAESYLAEGEYVKAKKTLERFIATSSRDSDKKNARKKIEEINIKILFSGDLTENSFLYEIKPGDTLLKIASQFNTTVELLKKSNSLSSDIIFPGKLLKVPQAKFSLMIDKSDNTLTLLSNEKPFKAYRVSTGENMSTPTGVFYIEEKMIRPLWYRIGAVVKPESSEYELGSRWMGISEKGYGIHGTSDESTIGRHITKGCVRMKNSDVEELYAIVPSGTEVIIRE